MAKKIIDNCTIYRLLDGMDKEKQRDRCLNALEYSNQESEELSEEKRSLFSQLFDCLSASENLDDVARILQGLILNEEFDRQNEIELLTIDKRLEYVNGFITLEELQSAIHDLMLDDYYRKAQTEYRCRLTELLAVVPESDYLPLIENIKSLKKDAIQKQLNPVCKYPN